MTTDVANAQMSYMMVIRTAIRSPLMLIFSVVMAYVMGGALATAFVVVIPVLASGFAHQPQGHARIPQRIQKVRPSE